MNGHLIQLVEDSTEYDGRTEIGLYWSPVKINEGDFKSMYNEWNELCEPDDYGDTPEFEDYWNERNEFIQIERIWVDEIYV